MDRIYIEEDCTLCGLCYSICVRRIIEEGAAAARITNPTLCLQCGHCKAICPVNAPQLPELDASEFNPISETRGLPSADQLMALFRSRRSIRIFADEQVEREKLESILQAGRYAPTGSNRQPLHYVVINTPKSLELIRNMALEALLSLADTIERALERHRKHGDSVPQRYEIRKIYVDSWRNLTESYQQGVDRLFYRAPAVFLCHFNPMEATTPEMDPGLAAMQMVLMAEVLGLGTCFSSFFAFAVDESQDLREILRIPEGHQVPFSFVLGHPDVSYSRWVARNPAKVQWF